MALPLLMDKYIRQGEGTVAERKAMPEGHFIKMPEHTKKPARHISKTIHCFATFSLSKPKSVECLTLWQVLFYES